MAEDIMGIRTRLKEKKSQFVSPRTHDETHSLPHVPPAVDTPEVSPCHHLQGLALSPFLFQLSSKLLSVGSSILLSRCFGLPSEILAIALFYLPTLQSSSLFVLREAARRTAFRIPSSKLKKEDTSSERGEFLVRRGREKEEEGEQDRSGIKRSVDILQPLDSPLIKKRYLSSPARLHSYSRHHPQLEFDSLDGWVDSTEATRQHETQKEEEEILHNPIPFPEYKPTEDQEKQVTCFSQSKVPDRSLPLRAFRHVPPSIERPNCYDRKPFLSSSPFSPRSRSSFVSPSCDLFSRDENLRSSLNLSYLGFLFSSILVLFLGIIWLSVHPTLQTERESKTSEGLLSKTVTTDGSSPHEELEAYAFLWSYRIAVLLFILATLIEASCEPLLISLLLSPSSLSDPALHKKSPSLSYDLVSKEKSFSKEEEEKEERREVSTGREQFFSYAGVYPCLSEEASVSRGDLLGCHRKSNKTDKTGYGETVRDEEKENRQRKDSETLRIGERDRPREEEEEENSRCIDRTNKRASTYRAMAEAASVTTRLLCILALITLQHFLKTFFLFPSDQEEEKKTVTHLDRREGEGRERNEQVEEKSVTSSYPLCNDQDFASSSSSSFSSFSPCRSSSSSRRLFRSSKIDDDSSVFTSCRGQEGGELHSGVHTQHSSCVHPVSPLLLPFQEATRAAFSSESWVIEVGKLLCVQPLLAFGMAQVTYSLVWMVVLGRASRDLHRGGEEEEDRGKERGGFGSPNLSFRQHFRNIQGRKDFEFRRQTTGEGVRREGEMKGHKEEEEESCAYEKSLKKESFVMFIWHFHRKAFEKLWGDLRGHRELLIGEKRKESGRGEKKKWVDMKSYVSSFRQLISLFVSFLSLCCSSLLASLFSFRFACGHHAAPPSRSSSSSSLWNEASSTRDGKVRSFFSSSYLSLHSPSSLNLPGMRRSSSERRIFHLDSRGTLPLSNPSPSSQRKKQGRKLFPRLSHMKAFPSRVHTEVARIERVLLAEEHRRLLRVNLGVMAQKFVAIEGEKFLLLSLLDSRAAGEYVFVSSAASILCRLLFAPIEEEAFNAFCSARQFEMTEREEGVMERDIQSFSSVEKDEEEKEKEKKKCKLMILGQQARGRDDMVKKIQSIEEERLKGEEEEEKGGDYEKVSSLGRQEREIVDQGQNTWMKEPMLMYDGGRALERQKKQEEERRELIRNWGDKEKREGDGTSLHTGDGPGVDDVRKDDVVYVHRGGSDLIMCQEGNIRQDGLRWRKPRGEEGGKSSMARQFDCLQVDPQVHHPANCFSHLPNGGRRTTTPPLHEKKDNRRCGREEEQQQPTAAPHPLLARTFNGDEEAVAGSPRAVRGDSSLCASSRGAKRRQIQTVYSRAERSSTLHTFPATRHEKGDRERERSLPDIPDVSMKSQSSVVWSKSLPLLRLLLLIEGTIGLVAATQGPIFARAALRLVYGPRWGNEPGAVAALQVYSVYVFLLAINGLLDAHALATASPNLLTTLQWLHGWAVALHLFVVLPLVTRLFPRYQAAGVVGAQCLLTVAKTLISLIPLAYAIAVELGRSGSYRRRHSSFCVIGGFALSTTDDKTQTEPDSVYTRSGSEVEKNEEMGLKKFPRRTSSQYGGVETIIPEEPSSGRGSSSTKKEAFQHDTLALPTSLTHHGRSGYQDEKTVVVNAKTSLQLLVVHLREILSLLTPPKPFTLLLIVVLWCSISTVAVGWVRSRTRAVTLTEPRHTSSPTRPQEYRSAFEQVSKHQCLLNTADDGETSARRGTCKGGGRREALGRFPSKSDLHDGKEANDDEWRPGVSGDIDHGHVEGVTEFGKLRLKDWQAEALVGACVGIGLLLTISKPFVTSLLLIQGRLGSVRLPFLGGNFISRIQPHRPVKPPD